jgi:hypothetical protein
MIAFLFALAVVPPHALAAPRGKSKGPDGGGKEHPAMHEAIDALRKAKSSTDPMANLNAAYHRLKQGRQNKQGYRARAMGLVEKAMEELKAKRKVESDKLIDQAITVIEKAVAVSPDPR